MAIIQFSEEKTEVTLSFDSGKMVEGKYGPQYMWSCNDDDVFYASEQFNALLQALSVQKGQTVSIKKVKKVDKYGDQLMTKDGNPLLVFSVNGQTLDTVVPVVKDSPVGAGFAHKDTKAKGELSMSELDYRLTAVEERLDKMDGAKSVNTEEEIPF
tara:strand:- start:30177 stop:30644 length:468 start_codon:yes stop_codon:yes gene_type:complete